MKLSCVLVAFALPCVLGSRRASDRDLKELRVYARKAVQLLNAIPWRKQPELTSSEGESQEDEIFRQPKTGGANFVPGLHSFQESEVHGRPRFRTKVRGHHSTLDEDETFGEGAEPESHSSNSEEVPFTILSSPLSNESSDCLRDRDHVTAIFKGCIYEQRNSRKPDSNVSLPEESVDDTVRFLGFCRKTPQLRKCVKDMIISRMEGCLDEGMHETIANVEEVTTGIIRFICNDEADRISIFITDGGVACWRQLVTNSRVLMCLNANLANHVRNSLFDLPSLGRVVTKCLHLELAERCVQQELELCKDRMSAPLAGVVFGIAREMTSCESAMQADQPTTSKYFFTRGTRSTITPEEANLPSTLKASLQSPNVDNTTQKTTNLIQPDEIIIIVVLTALIIPPILILLARIFKNRTHTQPSET